MATIALRTVLYLLAGFLLCFTAYFYVKGFRLQKPPPPDVPPLDDADELGTNSSVGTNTTTSKTILLWGTWFGRSWPFPPDSKLTCFGLYACRLISDQSLYLQSHAVVYHGRDSGQQALAPLERRPEMQVWVYYNMESPQQTLWYTKVPNAFNWTATYVRESDIMAPYGRVEEGTKYGEGFDPSKNYLEGKNATAIAIISNCWAASGAERLNFIQALSNFIDIDVYGLCGKGRCDNCREKIRYYKFYLAFENAYCQDYITEKFYYNGLSFGAVPVVISGANLSNPEVAPPGSFIDASKFTSAKHLGDFLRREGSEPKYYSKYFQWHSNYTHLGSVDPFCDICKSLHLRNKPRKSYASIEQWYNTFAKCYKYPSLSAS